MTFRKASFGNDLPKAPSISNRSTSRLLTNGMFGTAWKASFGSRKRGMIDVEGRGHRQSAAGARPSRSQCQAWLVRGESRQGACRPRCGQRPVRRKEGKNLYWFHTGEEIGVMASDLSRRALLRWKKTAKEDRVGSVAQ